MTSVPGDILNHQISRNLGNITSFYYITFDVIKLMSACIITLFYLLYNLISLKVIYVTFDTNLSLLRKNVNHKIDPIFILLSLLVHTLFYILLFDTGLLLFMFDENLFLNSLVKGGALIRLQRFLYVKIHVICFKTFRCLILLLVYCEYLLLTMPTVAIWYFQLVLSLSNDIAENPGPIGNHDTANSRLFSICNWNLNTLSKDDFSRIHLLKAHNAIHDYDIISLCETSLGRNENVPLNIFPGYQYYACNHSSGEKKGGVGIFYKESLPIKFRDDLSFEECIVAELVVERKKNFFTVLYRNPKHSADSTEFANFITNLSDLYSRILLENPYMTIFTGDFNAQSDQWWFDGGSNNQGTQLNILFSELGLSQLISEPTHFRDYCNPTCIDLIICDQPNLVVDSGVRSSLDESCKHQLTFCKFVTKIPKIHQQEE